MLTLAWIWWGRPESPAYDPEKALRLWSRSGNKITVGLAQMGKPELLPEDEEVQT
jgi:hypothetical protein